MSEQTFISIKNFYDRTVRIDDAEGNVVELPVRIRRFSVEQLQEFAAGYRRCENRAADRFITRKPDGDEQEMQELVIGKMTVKVPMIPDAEIRRRRLLEMSDADRERFEAQEAADETFIAEFSAKAIREHVSVKPGVRLLFETEEGSTRELQSGNDLAEAFAGNSSTLAALLNAVREENTLSADEKKRLRSLSALAASSSTSTPTAGGDAPAAIADAAEPTGTAPSAAVTDPSATTPSGSIAT
jgi:hypothetical protein